MTNRMFFASRAKAICFSATLLLAVASVSSADTIVNFQTPLGDFDVQLYDTAAPITVANFLNYVNSGRYEDSFFHRLIPGFVLQGGGFTFDGSVGAVEKFDAIQNEYDASRSNLRGTLAMAKVGADYDPDTGELLPGTGPDSATSEFFFNLKDNSGAPPLGLDYQNGGYAVFAEVMDNGMAVVDLLASQVRWNASGFHPAFSDLPLINYSGSGPWTPYLEMYNITIVEPLAGDFDADNDVDGVDFGLWQTGYPTASGATLADGDADGDGDVDGVDFGIWQANYPTNLGSAATIPEPATLSLFLIGGLALLRGKSK